MSPTVVRIPTGIGKAIAITAILAVGLLISISVALAIGLTETAKLTASDGAAGDIFGASVSLSGDTALKVRTDD